MTSWVARNVIGRSREVMLLIYKALIRPHIEYCVQIWSPSTRYGNWSIILELEKVQRKFTRLISGIGPLPYGERLRRLGLTTLAERRLRGDLIETYKIVNGLVTYGSHLFRTTSRGFNLVSMSGNKSKHRRDFFAERVIPYWNKLPLTVKKSISVNAFKANLDRFKNSAIYVEGNFWEVSNDVLGRIENASYLSGRSDYVEYLNDNPWVARKRGINIR